MIVHLCNEEYQPDIKIKCFGWSQPAWGKSELKKSLLKNVYLAENGMLYTFDEDLVSCDKCRE